MRRLVAAAVVVVASAVAGIVVLSGDGAKTAAVAGRQLPGPWPAAAFRVVYRVDDRAGPEARSQTDVVLVRRPFEARIEHRDGPPPGGPLLSGSLMDPRSTSSLAADGSATLRSDRAPGPLLGSFALSALQDGVLAGVAESLGNGSVAGQPCSRFAYRLSGTEPLARPTEVERVEVCVTADSILLSETVRLEGRVVRSAEAVEIDRSPAIPAGAFDGRRDQRAGVAGDGLVSATEVRDGPPPPDFAVASLTAPAGFRPGRRATEIRRLGPDGPPRIAYGESFVAGAEVVTVEQLLLVPGPAWPEAEGLPVDIGHGRSGRIVYRPGWVELRTTAAGHPIRVTAPTGTLAVAIARAL
jgi:hypothetical protein